MRTVRMKAVGALAAAALAGCTSSSDGGSAAESSSSPTAVGGAQSAAAVLGADEEAHAVDASVADAEDLALDGDPVTVTSEGTYRLSGKLTDGQVVVNVPEGKVTLVLDGVDITSSTGPAIEASEVDELTVVLADGSENTLTGSHDEDAVLDSAGDLTVTGKGSLTVHGDGNDGIASSDGLVIASGTVTVEAEDDGIRGKDYLVVRGGTVTVKAGGDGLKSDNSEDTKAGYIMVSGGAVKARSAGDGVDAATDLVVTGGSLDVTSDSASSSAHGLKAGVIAVLEAGAITVDSSADAVHSDAAVHFNGAKVTLAAGDDGVHAEGELVISKGELEITKSNEGLEGKDILVRGGTSKVTSNDDGVNASGSEASSDDQGGGFGGGPGGGEGTGDYTATITGGTLVVNAEGDGFDSNGTAEITGGTLVVNGPQQGGNGALDVNGSFTVSGGELLASGSAGMVVAPDSESGQGWLSATLDSSVEAGTTLHIVDSDGTVVASYVTSKAIQNIVYSGEGIESGEEYKVYAGGGVSGTSTGGLAEKGELGSGSAKAEVIATVTAGEAPEGGGFGGGPGRRQ
ncbi:carbohydrate-binding domain-containing protein [Streptomyces sp. NPDC019531]|uniref:carbohydrate-binding domain-containing protein n=1 Tax=Streptomyces sp. NPDC019531 TaxID=3365062 RepID=UPI00384C517F